MTAPSSATLFAHSLPGQPTDGWERLEDHLTGVAARAAGHAAAFGWAEAARACGQLHDIGKCADQFQAYLRGQRPRGGDHSAPGARVALQAYPAPFGRVLAFAVAGHHAGLADWTELASRLSAEAAPPAEWLQRCGRLAAAAALAGPLRGRSPDKGFTSAFLTRMLFSCLVDADFLETERFYAEAHGQPAERGGHPALTLLRERLAASMAATLAAAPPSRVNELRAEVLAHATARAEAPPGLFTLTVPTGGGKTLASLSFALQHALRHGLRRVVYVIPFTSIVEQTAAVFRDALGAPDAVLEHHASFDWDAAAGRQAADDEAPDGVAKLRRAAENWDAPIVVTTAVQFFESLYAARPSRCRKLHNLAGSVVVLDEAQTLPLPLLRPCMAAIDELARNYRASVVLCTATQPALRRQDGFPRGLDLPDERELAPDPRGLHARLRRARVEWLRQPIADAVIVARFAEQPRMLCIVNSRAHARALFEAIRGLPGTVHLTTLMCPLHRRAVLADLRARLAAPDGAPVRVVATSLIEAGVDVDFPEVWRAACGLDSIAQAAGRCNREGRLALGRTVVFEPAEAKPPHEVARLWQAARPVLGRYDDPLSLEAVRAYFGELYWQKGERAFDAATLRGTVWPILPAIAERASECGFPFASIAEAFRIIDEAMQPVIVPWCAAADDQRAHSLLGRIAGMERPLAADLRRLQQYVVSIPRGVRDEWLARGVLRPVHRLLGEAVLRLDDLAHYRPETGLDILDPSLRAAEWNIVA